MKKKHYVTLIKWALFVIYMILLFYVVFFAEGMGRAEIASGYKYNLTLFTEIRRYWRYLGHFDSLGWIAFLNIIGNVPVSYTHLIALRYLINNDEFRLFKTALSKLIKTVIKQCPHLTEKQLLDNMGFPANWDKISRYRKI